MKKLGMILLAGSFLIYGACRGPKGDTGPVGPQGNANVKGTDPFNVNYWQFDTQENAYFADFNDPDITASIVDHGVVQIFLYYPSDGTWRNLPDIFGGVQIYFRFTDNKFTIYYGNVDGTTPTAPASTYPWTFRTVIISPSYKQSHPNTNWKDYNQIMSVANEQASGNAIIIH